MGLLNTITNLFTKRNNIDPTTLNLADWHETDHQNQGRRKRVDYSGQPLDRALAATADITVSACVNFRKNQIRRVKWRLTRVDNGEIITESSFHNMLKWHHVQYHQDFFERWIIMLLIHGNVYMEKILHPETNLPGGIRILNSTWVDMETNYGAKESFLYAPPNAKDVKYNPQEILHDMLPSYLSDARGKSPMDRALVAVNIDRDNLLTVRSYLKNDNKPAAILTLDPNAPHYSDNEIKEFQKIWIEQGVGAEGGYSTRYLPAPFNVHTFNVQKPDMVYSYEMANLICREFAIDPALVGVYDQTDGTNKNTTDTIGMETKFINALTSAVVPDLRHIEEFINNHILLQYLDPFGEYVFSWNYDEIDRMIRYSDKAVDQLRSDYLSGVLTLSEYRKARFLPEVPSEEGGDEYTIPKGYLRVNKEDRGSLAIALDPSMLDRVMSNDIENAMTLAASSSPDFNQIAASGDKRPGENRYPVAE